MARKTKVIVVCDRHRGEVEAVGSVEVVVDGNRRSLDLCSEHLTEFRKVVRPWLGGRAAAAKPKATKAAAARPSGRRRASRRRPSSAEMTEIRTWARANGYEISDRGRLPAAVREAFSAAH